MIQPIRVFVINDHRLFADVVTVLLNHETDIALVGSAADPDTIEPAWSSKPCDVVLLDTTMEGVDAAQAILEIKSESPDIKVIVLGIELEEEAVLRFIEAGASGYISKDSSFPELLHMIKAVYHGQTLCSPRIAALVFTRIAELSRKHSRLQNVSRVRLTPREHEVLRLLALGCRNGEIAEQLGIALHTVKSHVHNLLDKLQARSRREAIERASAYGMLKGVRFYPSSRVLGAYSLA